MQKSYKGVLVNCLNTIMAEKELFKAVYPHWRIVNTEVDEIVF